MSERINLNKMAVAVSRCEGGKVNLPIAQIKEVIKYLFVELSYYDIEEVEKVIERYWKKYGLI